MHGVRHQIVPAKKNDEGCGSRSDPVDLTDLVISPNFPCKSSNLGWVQAAVFSAAVWVADVDFAGEFR